MGRQADVAACLRPTALTGALVPPGHKVHRNEAALPVGADGRDPVAPDHTAPSQWDAVGRCRHATPAPSMRPLGKTWLAGWR